MKDRRPWMKFNGNAWRNDVRLRRVGYAPRGLWADMISLMQSEADEFGYLIVNGQPLDAEDLAGLFGGSVEEVSALLAKLEKAEVYSRVGDKNMAADVAAIVLPDMPKGTILSRRMLRDKAQEDIDRLNGGKGGNPKIMPGVKPPGRTRRKKVKPPPLPIDPLSGTLGLTQSPPSGNLGLTPSATLVPVGLTPPVKAQNPESRVQKDTNLKSKLDSRSGASASPRPRGKTAQNGHREGVDWQTIVERMRAKHGFDPEAAWNIAMRCGERLDLAKRIQGAMRKAEERGRSAFRQITTIASEAPAP